MESKVGIGCLVLAFAATVLAQTPYIQNLPYNPNNRPIVVREPFYPAPSSGPRIYRARRDVLGGQISTNPSGGNDALLKAQTGIGTPDHNLIGTVFAAGNTNKGPVATGAALGYNINDHGLSVAKTHVPGVIDTTDYNARLNLLKNDHGRVDVNAFKSNMHLPSGFDLTKTGGNVDFNSINGHGAKFEVSRIPELGTTYSATGKLNLWESMDRATKLDLTGTASRTQGGLFDGRQNFGGGLGLTHNFG